MTTTLSPAHRKSLGSYYTPAVIAAWLASEVVTAADRQGPLTVLDPACGDGELLEAVRTAAAPHSVRLLGVDTESAALGDARERLGEAVEVFAGDGLSLPIVDLTGSQPDIVIANPPWGASLPQPALAYREAGFSLARGQFDSYDLFVELAIRAVAPGGVLGLVLPDSLLLPEHEPTRRLLLTSTHILRLVRLGEGIFDGVFRGTVLVVARRGAPLDSATVQCARLHFSDRGDLLRGTVMLRDVLAFHGVPQSRFATNPNMDFDLDVRADEQPFFDMGRRSGFRWDELVRWGRGIEIGKDGRIWRCPDCGRSRPLPRETPQRCEQCGRELDSAFAETIVRPRSSSTAGSWSPLIVGGDVQRYLAMPSREIRLAVPGIRYKTNGPELRKLLVRKTGVGIQAAIDGSGAQTTQTVFHCTALSSAPDWILDYLLGVLNSRPMQAFHLQQSGDHEWRSHPYVTPRVLRALPIPDPSENASTERTAGQIGTLARQMDRGPSAKTDVTLDELVAELYGIGRTGLEWARDVLAAAQQLQSIARLALDPGIKPIPVGP